MKRKLTAAQKRAKRERREKFRRVFINGKQKWVPREPLIEGLPVDEFIARNADPIWLHQNEMWELTPTDAPAWEPFPDEGSDMLAPSFDSFDARYDPDRRSDPADDCEPGFGPSLAERQIDEVGSDLEPDEFGLFDDPARGEDLRDLPF